jgi:hypothetical protein
VLLLLAGLAVLSVVGNVQQFVSCRVIFTHFSMFSTKVGGL